MTKIVVNKCYGGFSVSPKAALWMWEHGYTELGTPVEEWFEKERPADHIFSLESRLKEWREYLESNRRDSLLLDVFSPDEKVIISDSPEDRTHPLLLEVIKLMGEEANSRFSKLEIVEIPDEVEWIIEEYDGQEWISEKHRTW